MHILIIPSWYPSNDNPIRGIFFREQARALKNAGHQIGVIYPERKSIKKYRFNNIKKYITYENDEGIPTIRTIGWYWFPRIPYANANLFINDALELFQKYMKDHGKPEIIHAHSMLFGGVAAARIHKKYSIPFVVTEHSTAFARKLIHHWQKTYLHEIYESVSKLITVSPELGTLLNQQYECPTGICEFVPNIVNTKFFDLKNTLSSNNNFIFLTVSLLTYKKGHHILLKAFQNCFKDKKNIELWIGGDGEERYNLEKQVLDLGLKNQVKFLGALKREQVLNVMQCCDVFILPSLYETFGVVIIEAMACGRPVLATKCGGPECIVNDINGMLVKRDDVDALAHAMKEIMKNINKYDSKLIRQDCIARFSEEAVVKQLTNIYEIVLNRVKVKINE